MLERETPRCECEDVGLSGVAGRLMHVFVFFLLPVGFLQFVKACFPLRYSSESSVGVKSRSVPP